MGVIVVRSFYRASISMFVFFFSFAYAADQAPSPMRDELLQYAMRIENEKEALLEHYAKNGVITDFENLICLIEQEDAPLYHAMMDRLVAKSRCTFKLMAFLSFIARPTAWADLSTPDGAKVPALYITKELLEAFTDDEIEAVVAHEIGHHVFDHVSIQNQYRATLKSTKAILLQSMLFAPLQIAILNKILQGKIEKSVPAIASLLIASGVTGAAIHAATSPFVNSIKHAVFCWWTRPHEHAADEFSAHLTKNPNALAEALKKLPDASESKFCLRRKWDLLFRTHPYTEDRVAALEKIARNIEQSAPADTQDH